MTDRNPLKIAIASGKGGTGKTFIAVNLAALIGETSNILLVDLDVEEPNDALFIEGTEGQVYNQYSLVPKWDENKCIICDICSKSCKYHAVARLGDIIAIFGKLCHACHACSELCPQDALPMTKHKIGEIRKIVSGKITLVEGRLNPGEEQAVPLINKTHDLVRCNTENVPMQIFDCPPGTSCPVVAAVKRCDYLVLVTEPTPFGLNDLKLAIKTARQLKIPAGIVINRDGLGNQDVEEWCRNEKLDILVKIPYDREIARLSSGGELAYDKLDFLKPLFANLFVAIKNKALSI